MRTTPLIAVRTVMTRVAYVSGVIVGFTQPFAPGDQIIVDNGDLEGTVEELQLRYTVIRSTDGVQILVPNSWCSRTRSRT